VLYFIGYDYQRAPSSTLNGWIRNCSTSANKPQNVEWSALPTYVGCLVNYSTTMYIGERLIIFERWNGNYVGRSVQHGNCRGVEVQSIFPAFCLEWLTKTMNNLGMDNLCFNRSLNRVPPTGASTFSVSKLECRAWVDVLWRIIAKMKYFLGDWKICG
jgi:hypothetical protein